jgi:hypothetical protein
MKQDTGRILVATKKMQGKRKNDFCWAKEGEPVHFGFECDGGSIDDSCGCRRSMSGVLSGKGTTTVLVKRVSRPAIVKMVKNLFKHYETGWKMSHADARDFIHDELRDLAKVAGNFPEGAVLEKRGDNFQERE